MTMMTVKRISLSVCLLCLCVVDGRGEWWQGSGGYSVSVPKTYPIDPPSSRSDPGRRVRNDDDRPRKENPRNEPGFFQKIFDEWEKKKNARERQEEERRVKEEIARISTGLSLQMPASTMALTPGGTPFFNTAPAQSGHEIAAGPISGIRTPAERIPIENLRRAAAILEPVAAAMKTGNLLSDEDVSYLASQSALAMEGAPLGVEIRALPNHREEVTRQIARQSQELGRLQMEAEAATAERLKVEERLVKVQAAITRGQGDTASLLREREELLRSYKAAHAKESGTKEDARGKSGTLRYVWVQP